MKKKDVKKILFTLRTIENEQIVNRILGEIDMIPEKEFDDKLKNASEEQIKEYFEKKIEKKKNRRVFPFIEINDFFEYGINDDCVTFHLPGDFHDMFQKLGTLKASATICKSLIDAAIKINNKKNTGDLELEKCSYMYMISPIFYAPSFYPRELRNNTIRDYIKIETPIFKLFNLMGLETTTYTRQELRNYDIVKNNTEAQVAIKHYGTDKDVGSAKISFEKFNSKEYQRKLKRVNKILEIISRPSREER